MTGRICVAMLKTEIHYLADKQRIEIVACK